MQASVIRSRVAIDCCSERDCCVRCHDKRLRHLQSVRESPVIQRAEENQEGQTAVCAESVYEDSFEFEYRDRLHGKLLSHCARM